MSRARKSATSVTLRPRFRIMRGEEVALGPGKVELLKSISDTGSIAESAKELGMSYMRAWTLIRTMNACFKAPVVSASRGGSRRGGAVLTPSGQKALHLYRQMEEQSLKLVRSRWFELKRLLRE